MAINILIPMAGEGSRFVKAGFIKPKPFIDVNGLTMIERVIDNLKCIDANFILIGRKSHLENEKEIVEQLKNKYNVTFIGIDKLTEGTVCTILHARRLINNNEPLLIANSDQIIDINVQDFIDDCLGRSLDGSILTFEDEELNPKWSFAKINDEKFVTEVREKVVISNYATVGIYLFTKGIDFVNFSIDMIVNNDRVNNEFYTCPVYNYLIAEGKKIGYYNINYSQMHGIGTPADLKLYIDQL